MIAAGASDGGWFVRTLRGVHALGSALLALETRHSQTTPPSLSDLVFIRSQQLCVGWCVAGGALFVGAAGGGIEMTGFVFKHAVSSAVASEWVAAACRSSDGCIGPSVSLAACVVVVDMPAAATSVLQHVTAEFISIQAVGSIYGGIVSVMRQMSNATFTNISVSDAGLTALDGTQNGIFGLFAAHSAADSSFTLVSTRNVAVSCIGRNEGGKLFSRGIFGGVMYSRSAAHVRISQFTTDNITLHSSSRIHGGVLFLESASHVVIEGIFTTAAALTVSNPTLVAECFGGVVFLSQSLATRVSTTATRTLTMRCSISEAGGALAECRVKGGVLFTRLNVDGGIFSNVSAHSVALSCEGRNCFTSGGLINTNDVTATSITALLSFNCSVSCTGATCKARGALISIDGRMRHCVLSAATASNSAASCRGAGCYCLGGEISVASIVASAAGSNDLCSGDGGGSLCSSSRKAWSAQQSSSMAAA